MHDLGYVSIALEAFFILRGNSGYFSQGVYTGSHNFEWLTKAILLDFQWLAKPPGTASCLWTALRAGPSRNCNKQVILVSSCNAFDCTLWWNPCLKNGYLLGEPSEWRQSLVATPFLHCGSNGFKNTLTHRLRRRWKVTWVFNERKWSLSTSDSIAEQSGVISGGNRAQGLCGVDVHWTSRVEVRWKGVSIKIWNRITRSGT